MNAFMVTFFFCVHRSDKATVRENSFVALGCLALASNAKAIVTQICDLFFDQLRPMAVIGTGGNHHHHQQQQQTQGSISWACAVGAGMSARAMANNDCDHAAVAQIQVAILSINSLLITHITSHIAVFKFHRLIVWQLFRLAGMFALDSHSI
jgi:hypothetical protein